MAEKTAIMMNINSIQNTKSDPYETNLHTEAFLIEDEEAYYLNYIDSEISGSEKTNVIIRVKEDVVSVKREGSINSVLHYAKNKRTKSLYKTPYGDLEVEILTEKLRIRKNEKQGEIYIEFVVCIGGETDINHILNINYKNK